MAPWFAVLVVLEEPGSVPIATSGGSQQPVTPVLGDLMLPGLQWHLNSHSAHKPTSAHTKTHNLYSVCVGRRERDFSSNLVFVFQCPLSI